MSRPLPILPVTEALPALLTALESNACALLEAPPGAGKSTLVPLALLPRAFIGAAKILMLEPRRLAARAVASRMAQLLGEPLGARVGLRTRLETRVSRNTRIEVITEGILTRMLQDDPSLDGVAAVIFDEFHERSLNADLGLALCLECQDALRPDLKILVMSATLAMQPLVVLLKNPPVITSAGRSFDVDTNYVARRADLALELQTAGVIRAAMREHPGDALCFLPGAAEIRRLQRALESAPLDAPIEVLPLYGELPPAQQDLALSRAGTARRKIVLATSIAETSLTIEGIRIVVDSGLRRFTQFDPVTGMSRLETGKISQASADQRRGRAGRLESGVCYRLWSQSAHASLSPHSAPEILHADLAPLALQLACWGTVDAGSLRWLDAPPVAPLAQARDLLRQLDALDHNDRITAHGRHLARVGAHPRLAHMLVRAQETANLGLACDLAAILSERDLLRAPPNLRDADIRLRVDVMRGGRRQIPGSMSVDERSLQTAKRNSADWRRRFAAAQENGGDIDEMTGSLLSLAYPDRIGRARNEAGRYVLSNGRGAGFTGAQALTKAEFIVAAEVDGAAREARIFLAAPIDQRTIEANFAAHIVNSEQIAWDSREQAVKSQRVRRLGALVLESKPLLNPNGAAVAAAMMQGIREAGIVALPWTRELRQWQARIGLMRKVCLNANDPEPLPDLSDAHLLDTLNEWAPPWLDGFTRISHISRMSLTDALRAHLSYAQLTALERDTPTHFVVPSGSNIPIDYLDGDTPTLSVRLQEVFGLNKTPATANGRVPLLLKLLSPAGRPVQITADLMSFWERGYHDVKKDLKGRYPKHYWPDDPYSAIATRRRRPG